jgi:hypothetical protein
MLIPTNERDKNKGKVHFRRSELRVPRDDEDLDLGWLSASPRGGDSGSKLLWCYDDGGADCRTRGDNGDDVGVSWLGTAQRPGELGRLRPAWRRVLEAPWTCSLCIIRFRNDQTKACIDIS